MYSQNKKSQGQARRIKHVATKAPGDKVAFLKKLITFFKYLVLILVAICLVKLGIFLKSKYNALPIEKVKVVATYEHIKPKVLQEIISPQVATNFFGLDIVHLKQKILQLPWVKQVSVKRVWPSTIEITVFEQKAIANWHNESLLNEDGELFKPPIESFPPGLPIFSAPSDYTKLVLQEYQNLQTILTPLSWKIVGLDLDAQLSWHVLLNSGVNIYLGHDDIDSRLQEFANSYASVKAKNNGHANIKSVDLRYQNGFAIKWE